MAAFEVDRRDLAERGVPPARVVEALDEVEDGHLRLGLRLEAFEVEKLALERREEALAERVVVRVADRAHRGSDADLPAAQPERDRRVLPRFKGSSQQYRVEGFSCAPDVAGHLAGESEGGQKERKKWVLDVPNPRESEATEGR